MALEADALHLRTDVYTAVGVLIGLLHLVVAKYTSIVDVHELCDLIEQEINLELHGTHVLIHAEPCSTREVECPIEEGLAPSCQNCQVKTEAEDQKLEDR